MPKQSSTIRGRSIATLATTLAAMTLFLAPPSFADDAPPQLPGAPGVPGVTGGKAIYAKHCVSCHGDAGEGVKGEYSKPLEGDDSIAQLARYIDRWMPEDEPELVSAAESELVARYIYDEFYSPIAQARRRPARIELSRLTVDQYRHAVADLIATFRDNDQAADRDAPKLAARGLRAEYFKGRRLDRDEVFDRIDPEVRFDFKADGPDRGKFDVLGFTVRWEGALLAPETGQYEIIIRTDQAARLWLNATDDEDKPLIDAWVKSGDDTEYRASLFLVGGRAYPIKLEYSCHKQGVDDSDKKKKQEPQVVESFIELQWKLPHRTAEVIPSRHLTPAEVEPVFVVTERFPPDDRSVGYERGSSISQAWASATTGAAIETAAYVAEHLRELSGARRSDEDRDAKVRAFCREFVERAFRRPLTDAQRELYVERQFKDAPDLETAVRRVILLALTSPRFLYHDPAPGSAPGSAPESEERDGYHVASQLSLTLWDSLPDQALLDAAAKGELKTREQIAAHARRMIDDPRARLKMRQFLHDWLNVGENPDLAKDPEHFRGFTPEMASDLHTSLDLFLDEVVWGEKPDFRRLLLSDEIYVNGRLAEYYDLTLPEGADPHQFHKVEATSGGGVRRGIVSHPYLMASFAYTESSSPIHRGVFLARSVLGRTLRPPPEAFAPVAPDLHPDLTTRQRVALQTSPEECMTCHVMINSLGFALESFDATGRYREKEKNKPIDARGLYELHSGKEKAFDGAGELAAFLAGHDEVHRAFVVQLFHSMVKQPVFAWGMATPDNLRQTFAANDFDIRKLMAEIAVTAAFAPAEQVASSP